MASDLHHARAALGSRDAVTTAAGMPSGDKPNGFGAASRRNDEGRWMPRNYRRLGAGKGSRTVGDRRRAALGFAYGSAGRWERWV